MRKHLTRSMRRHGEGEYSLLLVVFPGLPILVSVIAAAPSILTEARREKR
jgi:hypothetical protein